MLILRLLRRGSRGSTAMYNMKHVSLISILSFVGCMRATPDGLSTATPEVSTDQLASHSTSTDVRCQRGTTLVSGDFCPSVEQTCLQWVDTNGVPTEPPVPGKTGRCGTFKFPTKCLSEKVRKQFCIDVYEYPNERGVVPRSWMTWRDVKSACEAQGKRLCTRSEWTFACEGQNMQPYPYGDGYHRDKTACNFDNSQKGIDVFKSRSPNDETTRRLNALLVPSGTNERCVSPFGVHDQIGNIDEQIVNETGHPYKSGLMGGHVFGVRNACRPMTEAHNEDFGWYETGGRCCADIKP